MANNEYFSRIIHKHDLEENWIKAATNSNFIPKQGEIIIYDRDENYDYERIKIGDGITNVTNLPFIDKTLIDLIGTKDDAAAVDTAFGRIAKAQAAAEAAAGAAQAAQNAADSHKSFSTVKVGSTSISADNISDTLTFVAGSNVSITPDATNDKITINVPTASGTVAGATIVYPAASCTTFSSDSGTVTPLAVQKGAELFAITRPPKRNTSNPANPGASGTCTTNNIVRWLNTAGDVQDSKITIEDVTNTKDTSKKAQVITIPAEGGKKMVYGYCTDQTDGTSFIGGVFDASATSYPYASGLAIGGTSGNLLWKGNKVIDAGCIGDYANKTTVDSSLSSTSTNPVQNKVINSALANKLSTTGTAAKATADANGNNIANTYAKKTDVSLYIGEEDTGASAEVINVDTFGGRPPEYYASADDVIKKSGDTMTGALTLSENPTADMHAATKQYVDNPQIDLLLESTAVTTTATEFSLSNSWKNYKQIYITVLMAYSSATNTRYVTNSYYPSLIMMDAPYIIFREVGTSSNAYEGYCDVTFLDNGNVQLVKKSTTYNGCKQIWIHGIK